MIVVVTLLFSLAISKSFVEVVYQCDDGTAPSASGCCGMDETCPNNCDFYTISNESGRRQCTCTKCSRTGSASGEAPEPGDPYDGGSGQEGNPSRPSNPFPRPPRGGGRGRPIKPFRIPNCEKVLGFAACQSATDFRNRKCSWEAGDHKCNEARLPPPMFQGPSYNGYPLDTIVNGLIDYGRNQYGGRSHGPAGMMYGVDSPDSHSWSPFIGGGSSPYGGGSSPYGGVFGPYYGSGIMLQFSREQVVKDVINTCNALSVYECHEWSICSLDQASNICVSNKVHFPEAIRTVPMEQPMELQAVHNPTQTEEAGENPGLRIFPHALIFLTSFSVTAGVVCMAVSKSYEKKSARGGKLIETC